MPLLVCRILTVLVLVSARSMAVAEEPISIPLGNRMVTDTVTLDLRELLNTGARASCGTHLQRVRLVAKSPDSNNSTRLQIGEYLSAPQAVPGDEKGFNLPDDVEAPWEVSRGIGHWNLKTDSNGAWLLHIQGPIKVRAVEILCGRLPFPPSPPSSGPFREFVAGAGTAYSNQAQPPKKHRIIIVQIDSLHPGYLDLNADGSAEGAPGDRLMPNLYEFVATEAAHWPDGRALFPQSTDTNVLNVLAGTNAGQTGVTGVWFQADHWRPRGLAFEPIHLSTARYADGAPVQTLFDLAAQHLGPQVRRVFVGNKHWVAEEYLAADGRAAAVDSIVHGSHYPSYASDPADWVVSFYDNPYTDPDAYCDPESGTQTYALDNTWLGDPRWHPRDAWIIDTALRVIDNEDPDVMFVLMGDLDQAQHWFGAMVDPISDPDEWIEGTGPLLPAGCLDRPRYHLVAKRNRRLYKEPILDLVRDVDLAFGAFVAGLRERGILDDAIFAVVSDHSMITYIDHPGIDHSRTSVARIVRQAGLGPRHSFQMEGGGSLGRLHWRPSFKLLHPHVVARAKAELLSARHVLFNPTTGNWELPWYVLDRLDMVRGSEEADIEPLEFYHPHFVEAGSWPDLLVVMKNGWQMSFEYLGLELATFIGSHGAPDTARAMVAIAGADLPRGVRCSGRATLADVGVTIAAHEGWVLPHAVGSALRCTPQ